MAAERPAVNLLRCDPRELQLYSSLKTAQQKVRDWPGDLPVPVLCTVGMQSAGKTTFIEALVGFRIGTTCAGTGTRCPVRYILKHGEPHFAVSGKRLRERREIQVAVERHMEGLALQPDEAKRFSCDELKVEITDHNLPLLDITDLPGLKAKGEGAEEIKQVVRFYVQSQSARPVVLVKATESVETQADVELLRDVGIDAKKRNATFVVNYFNDQLYKFSKASELNEYCRGYAREYGTVYFCMLIYSQDAKDVKDGLDFDGQCTYYRELPAKERETFDQKVLTLTKDRDLSDDDVVRRFGVVPAINTMQSIIRDFTTREGRRYADKIRPLEEKYDSKLKAVKKEMGKCNPEYIKEQRERYVELWGERVRDMQTCKKRLHIETSYNPMDSAATFSEEIKEVSEKNRGVTLLGEKLDDTQPYESWVADVLRKSSHNLSQASPFKRQDAPSEEKALESLCPEAKLTADASLVRLNDMFDFIIDTQITVSPVEENEARAISGYAPGDMPGAFDCLQVVKEVATRPLAGVLERLWPMLVHVCTIYEQPLVAAHEALKNHAGYTEEVQEQVTEAYKKLFEAKVKEQYADFQQIIFEKTSYMPAQIHERYSVITAECSRMWWSRRDVLGIAFSMGVAYTACHFNRWKWGWLFLSIQNALIGHQLAGRELVPRLVPAQKPQVNIAALNETAGEYCNRLKGELLEQFRSKVARSLFDYAKQGIISDVREELRQQIREVDAKRIDEDTKAKAAELRAEATELEQSLAHIRRVLDDIEQLNSIRDGMPSH